MNENKKKRIRMGIIGKIKKELLERIIGKFKKHNVLQAYT